MVANDDLQYDRSLLGVEQSVGAFKVTRDMILRYARSTGETNPLFTDEEWASRSEHGGLVAPPAFCSIFISGSTRPDIRLDFGDTGFFAGQAIESLAVVRSGDTLEVKTKLKEVYGKTGRSGMMAFAVWESTFTNQNGEIVALVTESFVRRNAPRRRR